VLSHQQQGLHDVREHAACALTACNFIKRRLAAATSRVGLLRTKANNNNAREQDRKQQCTAKLQRMQATELEPQRNLPLITA
jgi:hypothetical protein